MKKIILGAMTAVILAMGPAAAAPVSALSCLAVGDYLSSVVGQEDIVIFTATTKEETEGSDHTRELLAVDEVWQGQVESETFVYHQTDANWGYLCNNGPKGVGTTGLYVAGRDDQGQYNVYQRLELNDPLVEDLADDLAAAEITGEVVTVSSADQKDRLIMIINDLMDKIRTLIKEYSDWN